MAHPAPLSSPSSHVCRTSRLWQLIVLEATLGVTVAAQTPQQQYVYGSTPTTTVASQVVAYAKNQNGDLSAIAGPPFADSSPGGAMAIDGLGRFLFVINTATNTISMLQINQNTGSLTEVPGSPFATLPSENPNMAPNTPVCVAAEKSGQFLYVGYRYGNFANQGAINEYLIDAANLQLVPLPGQPTLDIRSSPVGLVVDPKGLHLYAALGLNWSTGVEDGGTNVYSIDPVTGALVPTGTAGNAFSGGHSLAIDPRGRFFFDGWGVTLGTIDSALISPVDGIATIGISSVTLANQVPAAMLVEGSGKFLYVQQGSASVAYTIDQTTGALTVPPLALTVLSFSTGSAAADPLGPYLYSLQPDGIHGYLIDPQSGALAEVPGSPFGGVLHQGTIAITGVPVQAASGPVAALFPPSVSFVPITVGQSSNSQVVSVTNTGGQALTVNSVSLTGSDPSDFLAIPTCSLPTVLSPNTTCTVGVVFSPTAAGARQANLTVADNASGSPQSILLSGTRSSPLPAVTLMPGSLTFGTTSLGSSSPPQNITVTSSGNAPLHIASVLSGGANPADFQVNSACSGPYSVGSSCNIVVTFSPLGTGQRTATVVINDDAPNSPQSVQMTGTASAPPSGTAVVKLTPSPVSFGLVTQGTVSTGQLITLTSAGTGSLHIASITLGGTNASDFSMSNNCTAPAYAVGATCTIGVSVSPLASGGRAAFILIRDDAPNSPQTINLNATVTAALTISPAAPGSNAITVSAGQTAAFNLQLTPGTGFAGNASFVCAGAPALATCTAPKVQISGGAPVSYVVTVATTKGSIMTPQLQRLAPVNWSHLFWLAAYGAILLLLLLYLSRSRGFDSMACLLRAAALVLLSVCLFQTAGCGGGGTVAAPQNIPSVQAAGGTPVGTSIITVTPAVTTSNGTPLPGIPPIQLTLTVQ